MTGENAAEDNSVDPLQTESEMAYESACASFKLGSGSYDGDIDSEKSSAINRPCDAEMVRYTKQSQLWSLLGKSHGPDAASRICGGACEDNEVSREQKGTSNLGYVCRRVEFWQLAEGSKEQEPDLGSLRVPNPVPSPESPAKLNPLNIQFYSPPLRPNDGQESPARVLRRPEPDHHSISLTSSASSSFVNLNGHACIEGPNRKVLKRLTDDQQVTLADIHIDEAKHFLIEANSTRDERSNALTLMADWNAVKADAQQRRKRSLNAGIAPYKHGDLAEPRKILFPGTDSAPQKQKGSGTSMISRGRRPLRKKLSGFFKKTPVHNEALMTSKSALSIRTPIIKADKRRNAAEPDSRIDTVNIFHVNADTSADEGTSIISASWSESTSDYDEAIKSDDDAPQMPAMPMRFGKPETPEVKRNYRNTHVIGSSPDQAVIIDNKNSSISPIKRDHQQPAKITDAASARSDHGTCATTTNVASKFSVYPFGADLISDHVGYSAINQNGTPSTPTHKRRSKASDAAGKRSKSQSILKYGERSVDVNDDDDVVTPTQKSFDASTYSGDEDSVHTAKIVGMIFRKATMIDIPARRGKKYPATINKDDPHNTALFSNPPDKDMIRLEAKAKAAQRAHMAPVKLKTLHAHNNSKKACKPKEEKADEQEKGRRSTHEKRSGSNHDVEGKHKERGVSKDTEGGSAIDGNVTARARIEGY